MNGKIAPAMIDNRKKSPGRPPLAGKRMQQIMIYVTPQQAMWLRDQPNASAKVRELVRREMEKAAQE